LINIDNIGEYKIQKKLLEYKGKNPYIIKIKNKFKTSGKQVLTQNQITYIENNYDKEPILINRVVAISDFLGESLKEQHNLSFIPKKILIGHILADNEKTYHATVKFTTKQLKSEMVFLPKTQILDDPYYEEANIDVDFEKYEKIDKFNNIDGTLGRKVLEKQKDGIKFLLTRNGAILADQMGSGKCLSINELVYTPNGLKIISDLKVGDYVIGSNGVKTKVIGVYPQKELKKMYKITFNDGYSVKCTDDHLWTVSTRNGGVNSNKYYNKSITLSVEQMLDKDLIIETTGIGKNWDKKYKIKTYYKENNGNNKWQIPIVEPIKFENIYNLPIEPYLLGVILGDGHIKKNGRITAQLHKDDFYEIFDGQIINELNTTNNLKTNSIVTLKESIISLGLNGKLSDTKFIPDIYKYSSIEDRLAILQGLMDTDGHCNKTDDEKFCGTEYCSVSEQLADDVAEIVHSLGGVVRKSSKIGSYKKIDGTRVISKKAYRLNIKLPEGMNPFRLKRKANMYNTPKKYKVGRYIKNIEYLGMDKSICIKVDAENSLFTLKHGIVTHNTYQAIISAIESRAKKVLIVCPTSAKINWQRELNYLGEYDTSIVSGQKWVSAKFTIINFDILKNFHTLKGDKNDGLPPNRHIVNEGFDLCIIDEAHNLKNHKSIRGAIMKEVCVDYGIDKVWLLSGTPVANRPMDFYNLLKLIKSPIVDNWVYYARRYCAGKQINKKLKNGKIQKIWLTDGASNLEELSVKTRNILLRRLTHEFSDMPERTIIPIYHDLNSNQLATYESLWEDYMIQRALAKKKGNISKELVELSLLRKFIAMETIPKTIEIADDLIEQGEKVVIFTCYTDELNELKEYYKSNCVVHYGEMTDIEKQLSVDRFQKSDGPMVFIGNIISAGTAITLTRSSNLIFNSFDWVPGNIDQAEFRVFRIGQKNNVRIYYNLYLKTITTRMWETIKYKRGTINTILNEKCETSDNVELSQEDIEKIIDLSLN
jgi:hypothetical protein